MKCRRTRKMLVRAPSSDGAGGEIANHLAGCADCRRFARRLEESRWALRDHHAAVQPGPAFSAAVLARVRAEAARRDPLDDLGWAAVRLLPAALLLALLGLWASASPRAGALPLLLANPDDGVLTAFVISGLDADRTPGEGTP